MRRFIPAKGSKHGSRMPETGKTADAMVVTSQKIWLTDLFYKTASLNQPMDLVLKNGHRGNTSCSVLFDLKDLATGRTLVFVQRQMVRIDPVTRKSLPLSEHFREQFGLPNLQVKPLRIDVVLPPASAFCTNFHITASHTDHMYHINQSTYLRFALDSAAEACSLGRF